MQKSREAWIAARLGPVSKHAVYIRLYRYNYHTKYVDIYIYMYVDVHISVSYIYIYIYMCSRAIREGERR